MKHQLPDNFSSTRALIDRKFYLPSIRALRLMRASQAGSFAPLTAGLLAACGSDLGGDISDYPTIYSSTVASVTVADAVTASVISHFAEASENPADSKSFTIDITGLDDDQQTLVNNAAAWLKGSGAQSRILAKDLGAGFRLYTHGIDSADGDDLIVSAYDSSYEDGIIDLKIGDEVSSFSREKVGAFHIFWDAVDKFGSPVTSSGKYLSIIGSEANEQLGFNAPQFHDINGGGVDLIIGSAGVQAGTDHLYIVWNVDTYKAGSGGAIDLGTDIGKVLTIKGNDISVGTGYKFYDFDNDGKLDIFMQNDASAADAQASYILFGSKISTENTTIDFTATAVVDGSARINDFAVSAGDNDDSLVGAGAWLKGNQDTMLAALTASFLFSDHNADGVLDIISKTPEASGENAGSYGVWHNAGGMIDLAQLGTADGYFAGDSLLANRLGLADDYYAKDVDGDSVTDIISQDKVLQGTYQGLHRVWLGLKDDPFDLSQPLGDLGLPDAYTSIA